MKRRVLNLLGAFSVCLLVCGAASRAQAQVSQTLPGLHIITPPGWRVTHGTLTNEVLHAIDPSTDSGEGGSMPSSLSASVLPNDQGTALERVFLTFCAEKSHQKPESLFAKTLASASWKP